MENWFIENGFEKSSDNYVKGLNFDENGLIFYIEYNCNKNTMIIYKFFKNYDITYRYFVLKENCNIKQIIKSSIVDMKTYLTFDECEHMYIENLLSKNTIDDIRWFREL